MDRANTFLGGGEEQMLCHRLLGEKISLVFLFCQLFLAASIKWIADGFFWLSTA